jgi:hypothetical protein
LQYHPKIHQDFSYAGGLTYVEKIQEGYHQGIIEFFSKSFDGKKAIVGSLEIQEDEATIAFAIGMPRTGKNWFKTTVTKNLEFRPYLKPEFQDIIWKKDIPSSHLERKWKTLLKSIQLYIIAKGRYDRVMLYHFKIMDHFTGKTPLNMPFYFHKSLIKMCNRVQAEPDIIQNTLFHFGLVKMIVVEQLKKKERTWEHFVFWEGFESQPQPDEGKKRAGKKSLTPQSSLKRRRAITPEPSTELGSSSKTKKAKKKLEFEEDIEKVAPNKTNFLNLPYTYSYEEPEKEEVPANESIEFSMEQAPETEMLTSLEKGEASSSKKKRNKSKDIKKLKEKMAQQEVLERVIKARYETLSKNFSETSAALERLALESIKEKKKKKKIIKDYNNLWWLAKCLKGKIKRLKARIATHPYLHVLAQAAVNLQENQPK